MTEACRWVGAQQRRVAVVVALLIAACSSDSAATPTQVMAVISAEPVVSDVTADVRIVVRSGQGEESKWEERLDREVAADTADAWPIEVSITPKSDDATRVYEVTATALDDSGDEVARVRAISGFVEGKALQLALIFEDACIGKVEECDETETCRAGDCADAHVDVTLLPPYSGPPAVVPFGDGGVGSGDGGVGALDAGKMSSDAAAAQQDGGANSSDAAASGQDGAAGGAVFAPANVDLATLDFDSAPATQLDCGDAVVDTADPVTITGWCGDLPVPKLRSQVDGPELVILPLRSLSIPEGTTLTLKGPRPVALIVDGDVMINGVIDASAADGVSGAGGGLVAFCTTGKPGNSSVVPGSMASGGGGGGGFGSPGGSGGTSAIYGGQGVGGLGGELDGTDSLVPLRGGCKADTAASGGAVQVSAAGTVTIASTGVITAAGAGGATCCFIPGSGSGGGSGGGILVEGTTVVTQGALRAHGGGGGPGSTMSGGGATTGASGHKFDDVPAAGGTATGGGGGTGGVLCVGAACTLASSLATDGADGSNATGGGGGGAHGRIVVRTWM